MEIFVSYPVISEERERKFVSNFIEDVKREIKSKFGENYEFFWFGNVAPGVDFTKSIEDALDSCKIFVPFTSFEYLFSEGAQGCLYEFEEYIKRHPSGSIIPAQLSGKAYATNSKISDRARSIAKRIDSIIRIPLEEARIKGQDSKEYREKVSEFSDVIHNSIKKAHTVTDISLIPDLDKNVSELTVSVEGMYGVSAQEYEEAKEAIKNNLEERKAYLLTLPNKNLPAITFWYEDLINRIDELTLASIGKLSKTHTKIVIKNESDERLPPFDFALDWPDKVKYVSDHSVKVAWESLLRDEIYFQKTSRVPLEKLPPMNMDDFSIFSTLQSNSIEHKVGRIRAGKTFEIEMNGCLISFDPKAKVEVEVHDDPVEPLPDDLLINGVRKEKSDT